MDVPLIIRHRLDELQLEQKDLAAGLSKRTYEETRVKILAFLDTDIFHVSIENCMAFLNPLIESRDINLETFGVDIILNRRLAVKPTPLYYYRELQNLRDPLHFRT